MLIKEASIIQVWLFLQDKTTFDFLADVSFYIFLLVLVIFSLSVQKSHLLAAVSMNIALL